MKNKLDEFFIDKNGNAIPYFYDIGEITYDNRKSKDRILSGIRELDRLIGGFEMGGITILTGRTNAGKTALLTTIMKNVIDDQIEQGNSSFKIFSFNGEQTAEDFKNNLFKQSTTNDHIVEIKYREGYSAVSDYYVDDKFKEILENKYKEHILIYNNDISKNIKELLKAMLITKKNHGTKIYFLDNFMQIDILNDNVNKAQSDIMEYLRRFAVSQKVHIVLVAHPKKIEKFQIRLDLFDILGSSNLINKAYNVLAVMRTDLLDDETLEYKNLKKQLLKDGYKIENCSSIIEVLKDKHVGEGTIGLKFNKLTKEYEEIVKEDSRDIDKENKENQKKLWD